VVRSELQPYEQSTKVLSYVRGVIVQGLVREVRPAFIATEYLSARFGSYDAVRVLDKLRFERLRDSITDEDTTPGIRSTAEETPLLRLRYSYVEW